MLLREEMGLNRLNICWKYGNAHPTYCEIEGARLPSTTTDVVHPPIYRVPPLLWGSSYGLPSYRQIPSNLSHFPSGRCFHPDVHMS